jgi:fructose-1,6-bisphosphatase/inositol monophosphatase family enzyme
VSSFTARYKGDSSPVTSADEASEALIRAAISSRFPSHTIVSEENAASLGQIGTQGSLWIVDP